MSDAPKRIWAVPSLSAERWGDGLCSDTPSNTAKSVAVEYIRADFYDRALKTARLFAKCDDKGTRQKVREELEGILAEGDE